MEKADFEIIPDSLKPLFGDHGVPFHAIKGGTFSHYQAIHIDESECFSGALAIPFRLYRNEDFITSVLHHA